MRQLRQTAPRTMIVAMLATLCWSAYAFAETEEVATVAVTNYELTSSIRVGRFDYEYTYSVTIENVGEALSNLSASVESGNPSLAVLTPERDFGDLEAAETDTGILKVRHSRRTGSFTSSDIIWTFFAENPIASWVSYEAEAGQVRVSAPPELIGTSTSAKLRFSSTPAPNDYDGPKPIELFFKPQGPDVVRQFARSIFDPAGYSEAIIQVDGVTSTLHRGRLRNEAFGYGGREHLIAVVPLPDGDSLQVRLDTEDPDISEIATDFLNQIEVLE